jgi:pimeloyl-ACP methyl ester carboxylesterase
VTVNQLELSMGTIEYVDTGGTGPTVVLLHGVLMDSSLWDEVVADLGVDHRCVVPTLPLGGHRYATLAGSNLSLQSVSDLVAEFLRHLDLCEVMLIGNDTGGALVQLVVGNGNTRVTRIGLVSCDAFDNFPPGLTGKTLFLTGKFPRVLFSAFMQQLRVRPMRRLPIAFGWLTKRGDAATKRWLKQLLSEREVQRDAVRFLRAASKEKATVAAASAKLVDFTGPALVAWAANDRVMPIEHGRRLATMLPQGSFFEMADSYTLVPLDQPTELAKTIRTFMIGSTPNASS